MHAIAAHAARAALEKRRATKNVPPVLKIDGTIASALGLCVEAVRHHAGLGMTRKKTMAAGAAPRTRISRDSDPVDAALRRLWTETENEPVPDALLALLEQIDAMEAGTGPARDE
jgi:hypothetical protein